MSFLTVQEFAKEMNLCSQSIIKAIKQGKVYAIRLTGGKKAPYRIPDTEVERLKISSMYGGKNGTS
jgi:excisionase family DNA binding protein